MSSPTEQQEVATGWVATATRYAIYVFIGLMILGVLFLPQVA